MGWINSMFFYSNVVKIRREHFNFGDNHLIGLGEFFSALRIRESVATLSISHGFLLNSLFEPIKRVQRISAPALGPRAEKNSPRPC
jgi:hypothetical protein